MTNLPLTFRRDKHGSARAAWSGEDASGHLLAQFFEVELGADATYGDRLLEEAKKRNHGHGTPWKTSGNLFAVTIEGSTVCLRPLFGANQNLVCRVEVSEFIALLDKWREMIG